MAGPLKKAINLLKTDSFEILRGKLSNRYRGLRGQGRYRKWIARFEAHTDADLAAVRQLARRLETRPLISILMPVYNSDERYLRAAIDSVMNQAYESWELCIADDHSSDPHVRTILAEYCIADTRIKVAIRDSNGHISAASNTALELVTGEFTALMDHDDELSPLALYFVAKEINENRAASIIYSDEDKINERGSRSAPFFKPDWSPELLLAVNYINHLTVYRTSLLRGCGAFQIGYEGSQDYDLLLRATENCSPETIRHIPRILYHWRAIAGSVAYASDEKPYAHDRARKAISEHLKRRKIDADVRRGIGQLHNVTYGLPDPRPMISIILHGEGRNARLEELLQHGGHFPHEIIDIASPKPSNNVSGIATTSGAQSPCSALNRAARNAVGSVLCFLDVTIEGASQLWLEIMVGHALQSGTGAVGPMIIDNMGRIIHAGFVLGVGSGIESAFQKAPLKPRGRSIRLDVPQNVSAVTGDCLVVTKENFDMVNGFDEEAFGTEYGAIDLCLRLAERGLRMVWSPRVEMVSSNGTNIPASSEINKLRTRWPSYFTDDPYYNPNLSQKTADYSLADTLKLEKY